jgi:hypothetical protein
MALLLGPHTLQRTNGILSGFRWGHSSQGLFALAGTAIE